MRAKHIKLLHKAVDETLAWRGSLTDYPDWHALDDFDKMITNMREAVKAAEEARQLLKEYAELCGESPAALPSKAWSDRVKKAVNWKGKRHD